MGRNKAFGFGAMALTMVAAGSTTPRVNLREIAAAPQHVIVQVLCPTATNVSVEVLPDNVPVRRGSDSVVWHIAGQGTEVTIRAKDLWPLIQRGV